MRRYLVFAVVSSALFLSAAIGTAVSVAFPAMISELNTSLVEAGWVLSIYQLIATVVMPVAGKMSDAFGRRRVFLVSIFIFMTASALCAVAPNVVALVVFRALQAVGGGCFLPCASGIVAEEFPANRQQAIGFFSTVFPLGHLVGPNLGGWLTETYGWRSNFWVIAAGCLLLFLAALLCLKQYRRVPGERLDSAGIVLLTSALVGLMFGLTELGRIKSGGSYGLAALLGALSIGFFYAFVRREKRIGAPLIDFELLRQRPFFAANMYNCLYGMCAFGVFTLVPLYAVTVYGTSIMESGIILTPRFLVMMVMAVIISLYLVRWGYRWPIIFGTVSVALSLCLLAIKPQQFDIGPVVVGPVALLLLIMVISGFGIGVVSPAANNACIDLMPDRVSTITGLRGMFRQLGGSIGIAISTGLLQVFGDMKLAFMVVFSVWAIVILLSLPLVFMMPARPGNGATSAVSAARPASPVVGK